MTGTLADESPQPSADPVEALAVQFLARLQAGENPDRQAIVRAHPDLGSRLERRLAHVELVYRLRLAAAPDPSTDDSLKSASDSADVLLAGPTLHAAGLPQGAPPSSAASYEIETVLGRGGMGVVYRARQKSLNRTVALKLISAGAHAEPALRARFRIEAELLASLQHPNIVQVFEVGEHNGCPFMAMELIAGGSLADHLAGRLQPPADAAELVETLARAMHAAHLRGIIHRDLKPANILLQRGGGRGSRGEEVSALPSSVAPHPSPLVPKITDFGLAKVLAQDQGATATGTIVGTPSYMAPEQAAGHVRQTGPATDVYALGAILYEMLTGQPPFRGESVLDTLRQVESVEPAAPSRLRQKVPRDLETICLKCLAKEPRQRYATAEALADELARFGNGEPIAARPVGMAERLWKWAKRRPAPAALIGVSVVAAVVLAVGGVIWSIQVRAERDRAQHNFQVARQAIEDLYVKMASERLFDEPQLDPFCQELLQKARTLYEELAQEQSDNPEVRRDTAHAWYRLGEIYHRLDENDAAEKAYQEAIARQEPLWREEPAEPRHAQDLANSHNWLGELLREQHRPAEAEQQYQAALALQQELARRFADEPVYRLELARSCYNLGILEKDTNRPREARADYDRAVVLLTTLHEANPADLNVRQDLARALINRGVLHKAAGRADDAGHDYDRAIELLEKLRRAVPSRAAYKLEWAIARQNRGNLLWSQGHHADARREHQDALALLQNLVADYSHRPRYKKKMAGALTNQGSALASANDLAGAEVCWNHARDLLQAIARDHPTSTDHHGPLGMTLGLLGWLRTEQKKWGEARGLIEHGIEEVRLALQPSPDDPRLREELRNQYQDLAETLVHLGDHAAAVEAAAKLAEVLPDEAQDRYNAACFTARCVPLVKDDDPMARQYIARAVAFLGQVAGKAPAGLQRLPNEKQVFQPLTAHAEFDTVLRDLNANVKR
jgi:serine/threonine protein kinase